MNTTTNLNLRRSYLKFSSKGKLLITVLALLLLRVSSEAHSKSLVSVSKELKLMGVSYTFTAVAENERIAEKGIQAGIDEVRRIEQLISSWSTISQTAEINKNAGIQPVKVDRELFNLITRANKVSKITGGYFDISFASLDKIWDFSENGKRYDRPPSEQEIKQSVAKINYKKIQMNQEELTVYLPEKGMKIGFGAIGKGYAANQVKKIMEDKGVVGGVVNAGGDLLTWGTKPNGNPWTIGIADPKDKEKIVSWINVSNLAVVTSGNYEKYIEIHGERYCHIINPKTGWPVNEMQSVTILCADAELADALATSVFVLGRLVGLQLINHLEGVECYMIDGRGEMFFSQNLIKKYWTEEDNVQGEQ